MKILLLYDVEKSKITTMLFELTNMYNIVPSNFWLTGYFHTFEIIY
jgi:hypothetical protein